MTRVAVVASEPIRPRMGGIGVRTVEIVRQLAAHGHDVRLLSPATVAESRACLPGEIDVRAFDRTRLAADLAGCECALGQGQLANDLLLAAICPVVVDLYDPYLVENLHYAESLGLDPYRNDHASWVLQLARGDFFLCASVEQRLFYLGFLTALGRVHPERVREDPDLARLIDVVPFGVPEALPPHARLLEAAPPGRRRLLFGGLYDWYDPWTLLAALEELAAPELELLLVRSPNPESTPQRLFAAVEAHCVRKGWWGERVRAIDWIPAERRFDLLREVDLMVAPHRATLETELALRTRFLDALAAGCPVVTSSGGAVSRLLVTHGAGWVIAPGDATGLAAALAEILAGGREVELRRARGRELARQFAWEKVLEPLLRFVAEPRPDASRERFAHRLSTEVPADSLAFRARRWLRNRGRG